MGKANQAELVLANPLHQDIVTIWESLARHGLDVQTRADLLAKYSPPSNGLFVQPPKINPEVRASVKVSTTDSVLRRDDRLADIQNRIGTCLSAIGKALTICLEEKGEGDDHKLIKLLGDTGRLLADVHHSESISRRNLLTFGLNKKFKETMEESPIDEWLFGGKFGERLNTAKSLEKSGADLKAVLRKPIERREIKKTGKSLNFYRPPRRNYRPSNRDGQKDKHQSSSAKFRPQQRHWMPNTQMPTRRR